MPELRKDPVVGRWIVKDPAALRGSIGSGAVPAPEFTPARDPNPSNAQNAATPGGSAAPAAPPTPIPEAPGK